MKSCGIDVGGTFSDFVIYSPEENTLDVFKISSQPENPSLPVFEGLKRIDDLSSLSQIVHGTTVSTNALIERKIAKIGLICTKGFSDIIEIGRQTRDHIYALYPSRVDPLVPKGYRFEVEERVNAQGIPEVPLQRQSIEEMYALILQKKDVESVAVSLLFSFFYPDHERAIYEFISEQDEKLPTSISSIVLPEFREFERTSATVVDAAISPLIRSYMSHLRESVTNLSEKVRLAIICSNTGITSIDGIISRPIETVLSGLAGGVLAARHSSETCNTPNLVSLDIGGTSTDVASIIEGQYSLHNKNSIGGLPIGIQTVDVLTTGAGGGSIASYVDGFFKVGPESAGANPGPACYNLGGILPTVTDANLVLGMLNPNNFAGGSLNLDLNLAKNVVTELSESMSLDIYTAAWGIINVFENNVAEAIRQISTERGYDPRHFSLLAFGGAGPLHACNLADLVGFNQVLIPPKPGVWSAFGNLTSDYRYDFSQSFLQTLDSVDLESIEDVYVKLEEKGQKAIERDSISSRSSVSARTLDLRYVGQSFELNIPYRSSVSEIRESFNQLHKRRYGFSDETENIEVVNVRNSISVVLEKPQPFPMKENRTSLDELVINMKEVYSKKESILVPVYSRDTLGSHSLVGPLIIEQNDTTTFIPKGWTGVHNLNDSHLYISRNSEHPINL